MAQSAFTSTESTSSSASTVAPVPPYEQGRRLHIVLDLDHTLVNANEGQQRHHPPDAHARPLHSFVMYNTENGTYPRYLLGLRDGLHDFLQELERLATVASIDSPNPKPNPKPRPSPSPSPNLDPNPNPKSNLNPNPNPKQVHVYTMGSRSYAQQVVNIIDPDQRLIFGRVLTRKDGEESFIKGLAHIVPNEAERRGCLVLDDRIQAWPRSTLTLTLTINLTLTLTLALTLSQAWDPESREQLIEVP